MNQIWLVIGIKLGYLIIAGLLLRLWRGLLLSSKLRAVHFLHRRYRFIGTYLNFGLLIGFLWVMLKYPLTTVLSSKLPPFSSLLIDDAFNLTFLFLYLYTAFYATFLIERKMYAFHNNFGSYVRQNGYRWLLVFNVILFIRGEYFYLPLMPADFSGFIKTLIESLMMIGFLVLQLLVLFLRRLNMVEAEPVLKALVGEVAAQLGVKIKVVRVWRLEGVTNAFATGFIRKSIFITENLLNAASPGDLRMIIGHECAHFKQYHIAIRVLLIAVLFSCASFLMNTYPDLNWGFYFLLGLAGLLIYRALSRYQELQADKLAAQILGDGAAMAGALARIFGLGSFSHGKLGIIIKLLAGHPDPRVRNERLLGMNRE